MEEEQISLSSMDTDWLDAVSDADRKVIASLEQRHHYVPGHQRLHVLEGNVLRMERKARRTWTSACLDLSVIDPRAKRQVHLPVGSLGVALAAALALGMLIWLDGLGLTATDEQFAGILAVIAAVGAGASGLAWRRYGRRLVFRTRHGRVPVVRLVENHPTAAKFQAFMQTFTAAVGEAVQRIPDDKQRFLAAELREHRRLVEAGAMKPAAYEAAKARILACHKRGYFAEYRPEPKTTGGARSGRRTLRRSPARAR
jgi:hypothetical protein